MKGDFTVLHNAPAGLVRLQRGTLEREISNEATFSISLFGNSASSTFKVTQSSAIKLETNTSGQIAIDTSQTAALREDDRDWFGDRETKLSRLALLSSGPVTSDPKLGQLIGSNVTVGVTYDLSIEDNRTSKAELKAYFQFAQDLGLTSAGEALADRLVELLPSDASGNLGKLEARYAVTFAPNLVKEVFSRLSVFEIRYYAAAARRRYYERYYATRRSDQPVIGCAYNSQQMKDWFDGSVHNGQVDSTIFQWKRVQMPDGTMAPIGFHSDIVVELFATEITGINAFIQLDAVIDRLAAGKLVTDVEFNAAVLQLLQARESIDVNLPADYSAMFAMIDGLAAYAYGDHASVRQSTLNLTLTPNKPGAKPVNLTLSS